MRLATKEIFTFDELNESAKETARQWWRESDTDSDVDYEDFESVADILGIEFKQKAIPLMGGGTRYESSIYYSGFASQGDGACFEGDFSYKKQAAKKIRDYAPQDAELHRIADELQAIQRKNFYCLTARMQHRGRYYHSGCMSVDVSDSRFTSWRETIGGDAEDSIVQLMRDFADWIYKKLQSEHDYRMSDENLDESILANEYEFDSEGRIQ